jgi:hypothetical protein
VGIFLAVHPRLDAIRFGGDNVTEVAEFLAIDWPDEFEPADQIILELPDGDHLVQVGDYIARANPDGDFTLCPGRIFESFYEPEAQVAVQ